MEDIATLNTLNSRYICIPLNRGYSGTVNLLNSRYIVTVELLNRGYIGTVTLTKDLTIHTNTNPLPTLKRVHRLISIEHDTFLSTVSN